VRPATALLKKYDRWQTILREAAEQSGRGSIPELAAPLDWSTAIQQGGDVRLLPWEEATIAECGAQRAPGIADLLRPPTHQAVLSGTPITHRAISLLVGPEGGITREEAALAQAAGWQIVSLGPRILRAETAALVSITLVMEHLQQLAAPD
jgi:16S rRNA (uracil1498-N3)-methyltransferase